MEARCLKSRSQQRRTPSKSSSEEYFLAPPVSGGSSVPWLVATSLSSLPLSPHDVLLLLPVCLSSVFLLKVLCVCSVVSDSLRPHGLQPTRRLRPWDFPGKSTGVGCHRLLHLPCVLRLKSNRELYSMVTQALCKDFTSIWKL